MKIYLAVTPRQIAEASTWRQALSYVAYRIGEGGSLLRENSLHQTRGGLLSISDRGAPEIEDAEALCAAVLRECARRNAEGAVLDFEEPRREDRARFAMLLGRRLALAQRRHFVPEAYAGAALGGTVIVNTAISGGNYREYLRKACSLYGGCGNVALDVQCVRMDFTLPAKDGVGRSLDAQELSELLQRCASAVFFSQDLCAHYFTYTERGVGHFVLFDDAVSLRQKLRLGERMGVSAAFFQFPEVRAIAGELFGT